MNWGGLGVALGAATQEWNNQRKMAREDEAFAMQKQQHANQQEQFGWQRDAQTEQKRVQDAEKALAAKYQPLFAAAAKGDYSGFDPLIQAYNSQQGGFGDGHYAGMQSTPQGTVVNRWDGKGNSVGSYKLDPQTAQELLQQAYMLERSGLGAAQFKEVQQMGLDLRKTRATERTADATMKNADTMEKHRQNQYDLEVSKPIVTNDGTGRIVSLSRDGKTVLGTFGAARPVIGHGGGGGGRQDYSLTPQEQAGMQSILERYNAAKTDQERAKIAQEYQMAQSYLQLRRGKVPNLPGGLVNNPKERPPVSKEEAAAFFAELQGIRDPSKAESTLRAKYPNAAAAHFGEDPLMKAGAAAFGAAPAQAGGLKVPAGPARVAKGDQYYVQDPRLGLLPAPEWERRTGNSWADLPVR